MKSSARLFLTPLNFLRPARLAMLAGVGVCVTGCASTRFEDAKVDPTSPIAAEVAREARANADYPSFSEIPLTPDDVRPLRLFGQAAAELVRARVELERATAPNTWTLQATESFAGAARSAAGPELNAAGPANTEAFADDLRRRATPPPSPQR